YVSSSLHTPPPPRSSLFPYTTLFRSIEFQRNIGDREQQQTIRPAVRRLVLLRHNNTEVPFSPDGPLTWGEIDLVRTDVFTPALADRKSTRLNSSHVKISYAVFCLKKK